jgi:glycosyltransferase involved in cell wall biosynthesis
VGINKPHKNLATLVDAWRRLGDRPPLQLVTAGPEDPRYPGVAALAQVAGAKSVAALGHVSEGELHWLYLNATLVLFPSLYEGFGFPLAEAMAHGAAALVSDIPPLHEIGDGVARFVPPLDASRWADGVRTLADDAAARSRMGEAGRIRARSLDYAVTAAGTLEILRRVGAER